MDSPAPPPPGLGQHCVGLRVVVRRVVRGERGPTGGPAFTDLLGVMEAWSPPTTTIRGEDGSLTEIALADIVSGKPVPPRPSVRSRVTPEQAEVRAAASWPEAETAHVGDWLLRASPGCTSTGSALLVGEPDRASDEALAAVAGFYTERHLPVLVQVVVGSRIEADLERLGWRPAGHGEADVAFLLGGVAAASRAVRRMARSGLPSVELTADPPGGQVVSAQVRLDGAVVARGRAAMADEPDPWVGIAGVQVAPEHRRRGLGAAVVRALLGWAAEQGATTAHLQVPADDHGALHLSERLGFTEHHTARLLRPPAP